MRKEIIYLFIILWPGFITSFLILAGIINGIYVQSFVYLSGILICLLFWFLLGNDYYINQAPLCRLSTIQLIGYNFIYPDLNTIILWYTNAFLLTSMIYTADFNISIFSILFFGSLINALFLWRHDCIVWRALFYGIMLGIGIGIAWFLLFWLTDNKQLLYLSLFVEKTEVCTILKQQDFKCSFDKND